MIENFKKIVTRSLIVSASALSISWIGVSTISESNSYGPSPAATSTGKAAVIWMNSNQENIAIQASIFDGVYWQTYETISAAYNNVNPSIRLDASGNALALWEQISDTSRSIVFTSTSVEGEWQTPETLSTANSVISSSLAMNETGQAYAGWINQDNDSIEIRTSLFGAEWSPIQQISGFGGYKIEFIVKTNAFGDGVAIWVESETGTVYSSRTTSGFATSWTTPEVVSDGGFNTNLSLSLNDDGNALAAWVDNNTFSIYANTLTEGSWGSVDLITDNFAYFPLCKSLDSARFATWLNLGTGMIEVRRYISDAWDPIEVISGEGPNDIPFMSGANGTSSTVWADYSTGGILLVDYGTTGLPTSPESISAADFNYGPKIICSSALKVATWENFNEYGQFIQVNVE